MIIAQASKEDEEENLLSSRKENWLMVKGAKARKCNCCGQIVFWLIPTKCVMGFQEVRTEKVKAFVIRENKLWCAECYEKHMEDKTGRTEK